MSNETTPAALVDVFPSISSITGYIVNKKWFWRRLLGPNKIVVEGGIRCSAKYYVRSLASFVNYLPVRACLESCTLATRSSLWCQKFSTRVGAWECCGPAGRIIGTRRDTRRKITIKTLSSSVLWIIQIHGNVLAPTTLYVQIFSCNLIPRRLKSWICESWKEQSLVQRKDSPLSRASCPMLRTNDNLFRFAACASGICVSFWFYGVLQEKLLTHSKLGATFVLVSQTIANCFVALLWQRIENHRDASNPKNVAMEKPLKALHHPLLIATSATYVFAMTCSNEALRYVSYPTAVLAKSCKLIPTMIMGSLVERRAYSLRQWSSAVLITTGISLFHLSRIQTSHSDMSSAGHDQAWIGMTLLSISLLMDGFLNSFQGVLKLEDRRGKRRPPTAVETMLYVNAYALFFLIPMAATSGQLKEGLVLLSNSAQLAYSVLILNGVVSVGQIFIFLTITWYSSLVCTTITTTRKFFTILFSVLYFGHHFSLWQWNAVCLVFGGLFLSISDEKGGSNSHSGKSKHAKKE